MANFCFALVCLLPCIPSPNLPSLYPSLPPPTLASPLQPCCCHSQVLPYCFKLLRLCPLQLILAYFNPFIPSPALSFPLHHCPHLLPCPSAYRALPPLSSPILPSSSLSSIFYLVHPLFKPYLLSPALSFPLHHCPPSSTLSIHSSSLTSPLQPYPSLFTIVLHLLPCPSAYRALPPLSSPILPSSPLSSIFYLVHLLFSPNLPSSPLSPIFYLVPVFVHLQKFKNTRLSGAVLPFSPALFQGY